MEELHDQVYGGTFALYSQKELDEFIEPLRIRFKRNGLDPKAIFEGKRCLDAGCGNGRGINFMLENGAEHVTGFDFSATNIQTAGRLVAERGYENVDLLQGTLEELPFDDQHFDFVWCNGVIMHTMHPNRCLEEISRVLKVGGQSWVYIYGAGGAYWRIILFLRQFLKDVTLEQCMDCLALYDYDTRYVAEYIDDWYVPYLRMYCARELDAKFADLGFESPTPLLYGVDYDTSQRLTVSEQAEVDLMGEGDLRYFLTKTGHPTTTSVTIPEEGHGSNFSWPKSMVSIDRACQKLETVPLSPAMRVAVAAYIQRKLRLEMTKTDGFRMEVVTSLLQRALELAGKVNR